MIPKKMPNFLDRTVSCQSKKVEQKVTQLDVTLISNFILLGVRRTTYVGEFLAGNGFLQ